jgi:hypothetical protein
MANTPPNFDFNEWMQNAAKYLPNVNLNIHDTLEQVNKKLRKGMEKATVTVKSLGLTSHAYLNSMYEQSTQRWSEMKGYRPSINMPTISLPSMRYPPVGQLANRMRMGVGNMLFQMREFCGTNDLTHTNSFNDLELETNALNQVGATFIIKDSHQFGHPKDERQHSHHKRGHSRFNSQYQNFYKFLHLMREAKQREENVNTNLAQVNESEPTTPDSDEIAKALLNIKPSTSAQASLNSGDLNTALPSTSSGSSSSSDGHNLQYAKILLDKGVNEDSNDDYSESDNEINLSKKSNNMIVLYNENNLVNHDSNLKLKPDDLRLNSKRSSFKIAKS